MRLSNIELFRIVCMILIVMWHINIGIGESKSLDTWSTGNFINAFSVVGVNCFLLISGYFGISVKKSGLIKLISQCLYYSVLVSVVFAWAFNIHIDYKSMCFPLSSDVWWFMTTYLMLYLTAPLVNKGLEHMNLKEISFIVLSLTIVCVWMGFCFKNPNNPSGHSYLQFLYIYVIGRLIRLILLSESFIKSKYSLITRYGGGMFMLCTLLNMTIVQSYRYNNPLVVIAAVFLFVAFLQLKLKSNKTINSISGTVLVAYLLHEHHLVRPLLAEKMRMIHDSFEGGVEIVCYLLVSAGVIMIAFVSEQVRKFIFTYFEKK